MEKLLLICVILVLCLFSGNSAIPQQNAANSNEYEECDSSSLNMIPPCCGTINESKGRIIGGTEVEINKYPWMVRIKGKSCGGSLINNRFVLSAAHCFKDRSISYKVQLGSIQEHDEGPNAKIIPVEKVISHHKYTSGFEWNDIALLKLKYPVEFSASIKPICLPYKTSRLSDFVHKDAVAAGWGSGSLSPILQEATVEIWEFDECESLSYLNKTYHICAGGIKGIDTCGGDSGGPLFLEQPKTIETVSYWMQIGITSFGFNTCGIEGSPGVYTNVISYIDWIHETMKKNL